MAGHERQWDEVGSARPDAANRRLLIAVHGSNQTPRLLRSLSGGTFDDWALDGHVVVYPRSWRGGLWNDARASTRSRAREDGVDDVAFIEALASHYLGATSRPVDRAYGVGFSNGGQLLIRVVLESHVLSAVALVSATVPATTNMFVDGDPGGVAIPMMLVHGTRDSIVPFEGGMARVYGRPRGLMRSFAESTSFWTDRAGIETEPEIWSIEDSGPRRGGGRRLTYRNEGRPPVIAYELSGGGHRIPNRYEAGTFLMGRGNHSIDTMTELTRLVELS